MKLRTEEQMRIDLVVRVLDRLHVDVRNATDDGCEARLDEETQYSVQVDHFILLLVVSL